MQSSGMANHLWQLLTYKRPRSNRLSQISTDSTESTDSGIVTSESSKNSLFKEVQFSEIVNGDTCPPLSMEDLTAFCAEVEHSSENLQFYLSFLAYSKKWDALSEFDQAMSPDFVLSTAERRAASRGTISTAIEPVQQDPLMDEHEREVMAAHGKSSNWIRMTSTAGSMVPDSGAAEESRSVKSSSGLMFPNKSKTAASTKSKKDLYDSQFGSISGLALSVDENTLQAELVKLTGTSWDLLSPLPLRKDLQHLVFTYLLPSSPQQLSIPHPMLVECLYTLHRSSSPAGLWPVVNHVYHLITRCTMPNFIRYSTVNATRSRQVSSIITAALMIVASVAMTLINIFTGKPKIMRALNIPFFWLGCSALICALEGFCFLLILRRRLQINPGKYCNKGRKSSSRTRFWRVRHHWKELVCSSQRATGTVRLVQNAMLLQAIVKGFLITAVFAVAVAFIPNHKIN